MTFILDTRSSLWHYECDVKGCDKRTPSLNRNEATPDSVRAWKPGLDTPNTLHFCPQHMHDFDVLMAGDTESEAK